MNQDAVGILFDLWRNWRRVVGFTLRLRSATLRANGLVGVPVRAERRPQGGVEA